MARTPLTPVKAQQNAADHAIASGAAAVTVAQILDGTFVGTDDERGAAIHAAAKTLEAAGCYIRRQHAAGLLIP